MDSSSQTRKSKQTKWTPKSSDRICSLHFVDGIPTKANPLPTMHIGFDTKRQKTRSPLFKQPLPRKKTRAEEGEMEIGIINNVVPAKHREISTKIKKHSVTKSPKKLTQRDKFLLILMRLRLGILNEDLTDRFCISPALCSRTFTTWIRLVRQLLGHALVVWLPREAIRQNLPNVFRNAGYSNCRVVLDCAEVFIERSKSLDNQAYTWSDYKHHNTIKFLVGISLNGLITLLSDCYGGRATEKYITKDGGFYDHLQRGDQVMADRGFQIKEELLLKEKLLQMTSAEVKKTKDEANLRIHVERAVNCIKSFRILENTLPVSLLQHIDDILWTCAALCNLKPKLIYSKKQEDRSNV